jgi:hypothetical protein
VTTTAEKLQIRPGQTVALLHDGVNPVLPAGGRRVDDPQDADAVVLFATDRAALARQCGPVIAAANRDALAWVAYPKAGQLGTDLTRDRLREALAERGVQPVRQVSVDEVWSALRFRPRRRAQPPGEAVRLVSQPPSTNTVSPLT